MSRKDAIREEGILMEVVVDAYGPSLYKQREATPLLAKLAGGKFGLQLV